ncbi:DoxX family protein [Streptomyces sp. NRAIS4]
MNATAAIALAVFLIAVGIGHFLLPGYFRTLVPSWLGRAGLLVAAGGAAEIVIGAGILTPAGRTVGGWAAAALITAYLVCHLDALWRASLDRPRLLERPVGAAVRLAVNLVYIGWAIAVARGA